MRTRELVLTIFLVIAAVVGLIAVSRLDKKESVVVEYSDEWTAPTPAARNVFAAQPSDAAVEVGEEAAFSVETECEVAAYQWQYSTDGGNTWEDVDPEDYPSAVTASFSEPRKASQNGNRYRCVVTLEDGTSEASEAAALTILASIRSEPADYRGRVGMNAAYFVSATGAELTYRWQMCPAGEEDAWSDVSTQMEGYDAAALRFAVSAEYDGAQFRCVVRDANGLELTSSPAAMSVADDEDAGEFDQWNLLSVGSGFYEDESYPNIQGLCTDGAEYVFIACREGGNDAYNDAQPTMLRKLDTDGNVAASNGDTCYCHANSLTYCEQDKRLYISTLGRPDNVEDGSDASDPQQYNVIGVADAETLENLGFFSVEEQMAGLGTVLRSDGTEGSRYLKAVYYDAGTGRFIGLTKDYSLSSGETEKFLGLAVFDFEWNLLEYHEYRIAAPVHTGSLTADENYIYCSDNVSGTIKYMLVFDREYHYIGQWALLAETASEMECADFIGGSLYASFNTDPVTVEKMTLAAETITPRQASPAEDGVLVEQASD